MAADAAAAPSPDPLPLAAPEPNRRNVRASWCFTINNPTDDDDPLQWEGVKYCIYQEEKGDNDTKHYQGYVEWSKPKRLTAVKKINARAHWEPRKGTAEQAIAYCSKEDTRVDGPWEKGAKSAGPGFRTDIHQIGERIKQGERVSAIAGDHPGMYIQYGKGFHALASILNEPYDHGDVRGKWYWGEPGTGKSFTARQEHPDAFLKQQNKWWDGYEGQDAVILDDLDKFNKLGHHLKIWTDRYSCSGEVKGATVNLSHKVFVVTSNYHPDDLWEEDHEMREAIKRRFKITKFTQLKDVDDIEPPPLKRQRTMPRVPDFSKQDAYIDGIGASAMAWHKSGPPLEQTASGKAKQMSRSGNLY